MLFSEISSKVITL